METVEKEMTSAYLRGSDEEGDDDEMDSDGNSVTYLNEERVKILVSRLSVQNFFGKKK